MAEADVQIDAPDIEPYRDGNAGLPYVTSFEATAPGPHVVITALVHGNELCGAHALVTLLERGVRPRRGRLSLAFVNVEAYRRFDPENPKATRYVDEDFNRVWDAATLEGPRQSRELERARELRPLIESADRLLDLHSMQLPSAPLLLAGTTAKSMDLARRMAYPAIVVNDAGHRSGGRMRDFGGFSDPASAETAMLVECGQHWARASVDVAIATCRRFLVEVECVDPADLEVLGPPPETKEQRTIEVTHPVTVEQGPFRFVRNYQGLEVIAEAGTVIAHDGGTPVMTPYDDCVLVMPSERLARGLTAVRLGRYVA